MGTSGGLSKKPPTLGYHDFEHKARARRPFTSQKMNTRELVGKSFVGFTRSQRGVVVPSRQDFDVRPRYFVGIGREHVQMRKNEKREAGKDNQCERHLDAEREQRRNAEWEERAALVNEYKIGVPSSPFKRPAVLQSPRHVHNGSTADDYCEEETVTGKPVDTKLQAGLWGAGVFNKEEPVFVEGSHRQQQQHANRLVNHRHHGQPAQMHLIRRRFAKSKMYSGQLFRGTLMPANTRWMPEDASNLAVGPPQLSRQGQQGQRQHPCPQARQRSTSPRYQKRQDPNSIPVGFFSRKKALAPARIPSEKNRSVMPSEPLELLVSSGKLFTLGGFGANS
jgi:hypothetical protein